MTLVSVYKQAKGNLEIRGGLFPRKAMVSSCKTCTSAFELFTPNSDYNIIELSGCVSTLLEGIKRI